ncbi:MAG: hypothetical protein M3179_12440 [Actinomycetota bacterium]|nr:hypothetical protein [Actinomycetota bacterium]
MARSVSVVVASTQAVRSTTRSALTLSLPEGGVDTISTRRLFGTGCSRARPVWLPANVWR